MQFRYVVSSFDEQVLIRIYASGLLSEDWGEVSVVENVHIDFRAKILPTDCRLGVYNASP